MSNEIGNTLLNSLTNSTFDVGNMAKVLAEADQATPRSIIEKGQTKATTELGALTYLELNLNAFNSYVADLTSPDLFNEKQASSSDDSILSVTASSSAVAGSYSVTSQQLAQSHTLVGDQTFASQYEALNQGNLTININGQQHDIAITSSNNTLEGLKESINNGDFGVSAAILNNGGVYQLMLSSKESGAANAFTVSSDNNIAGIDALGSGVTTTVEAQDAMVNINGLTVSNSTNTFTDLIDGVTVDLNTAKPGEPQTISVTQDPQKVVETVQTFVDIYNQLGTILEELGKYDKDDLTEEEQESEEFQYYGDLAGNNILRQVKSELRTTLSGAIDEISGNVNSLAVVGISFDLDGVMELDEATLTGFAESDLSALSPLFARGGYSEDSLINVIGGSENTQAGSYALNITQTATRAELASNNFVASSDQQVSGERLANTDQIVTLTTGATMDLTLGASTQTVDFSSIAQTYDSKSEMASAMERSINEAFGVVYDGTGTPTTPILAAFSYDVSQARFEIKSETGTGTASLNAFTNLDNQGFVNGKTYASESLIDLETGSPALTFDIKVDDSNVANISLANGRYTASEFANLVTSNINGNSELTSVDNSVTVSASATAFNIASNRFGAFSSLEISNVSVGLANSGLTGLTTSTANGQSVDGSLTTATGTVNIGAYADSKDGRLIKISDFAVIGDEEAEVRGLTFQVLGGATGSRGDLNFSNGFAARLQETITGYFDDDTGLIKRRSDTLDDKLDDYKERNETLDLKYEKLELKYRLQFSALQSIMSQAESTRDQLTAQFNNNN